LPPNRVERLRQTYRQWLESLGITHFVTFNFGYRIGPYSAEYAMKGFCGRLERMAFGRNYAKRRCEDRLVMIGFLERADQNPHWHAVVRANADIRWALELCGPTIWEELQPRGQLWVEPIEDERRVISYSTKRLTLAGLQDKFLYAQNPPKLDDL